MEDFKRLLDEAVQAEADDGACAIVSVTGLMSPRAART